MSEQNENGNCPICNKEVPISEIVQHVDVCLFLNSEGDDNQKRKRQLSPNKPVTRAKFNSTQKSPRDVKKDDKPKKIASIFQRNAQSADNDSNNTNQVKSKPLASIFQRNVPSTSTQSSNETHNESQTVECDLSFKIPLAKQLQPKSLEEFFGQNHVLGKDSVLRSLIEKGDIPNMILWGPPGCGKTSLSNVIKEICNKNNKILKFKALSATDDGVKAVRTVVTEAKTDIKFGKRTVLFMDEIHRFNKKQQDTFLLSVEKGEIILIGATTENPSFSINNALLSRCRVIVMEKLNCDDLYSILVKAAEALNVGVIDTENPCGLIGDDSGMSIEEDALKWLSGISDGDARIALNNLQVTIQHCNEKGKIIKVNDIKDGIKKSHMLYDRAGEEHYNIISAMHKSIRGSDANAALYWTTRMIVSGEDPLYIARRLVRAASEDIGNADPNALQLAVATMQGCQLIGMPEADVLLAQCAIYLARAPKSREADSALAAAKAVIKNFQGPQPSVPMHIRNAPTKLMKDLGYGTLQRGEEFIFMPPELKDVDFFN